MANGLILFKDKDSSNAIIVSQYIVDEKSGSVKISGNLLNKISVKHGVFGDSGGIRTTLSYRTEESKYLSVYITDNDKEEFYFLVFLLDRDESAEYFSVMTPEMQGILTVALNKGSKAIKGLLQKFLVERNQLKDLIRNKQKIEKKITHT
ncbi:MAG: hypothetical protein GF364_01130, partial [Candidatus Lokiarchaeota archaeon]|nr:hypothetical protein [Candidatus Lokiarchaeota archaeon]